MCYEQPLGILLLKLANCFIVEEIKNGGYAMVKSKKYVLVSLVLGLSAVHGASAASLLSAGVGPKDPSAGVAGGGASDRRVSVAAPVPEMVGAVSPITQKDLVQKFFPVENQDYAAGAPTQPISQPGTLWTTTVDKTTTQALLDKIIVPYGLPVHRESAVETIEGAYRALVGLIGYQKKLLAAMRGGPACIESLDLGNLFGLNLQAKDKLGEGGHAYLEQIRDLFIDLAERSKNLDSFDAPHLSGMPGLGGLGEVGAALGTAATAAVAEFGRNIVAAMHEPLFNAKGSVVDNVRALYGCLNYVRQHIYEMHHPYSVSRMAILQAQSAAAQAESAAARAPLDAVRGELADARAALAAARADYAALLERTAGESATQAARIADLGAALALAQSQTTGVADSAQAAEWARGIGALTDRVDELTGQLRAKDTELLRLRGLLRDGAVVRTEQESARRRHEDRIAALLVEVDHLKTLAAARADRT
jgi:hypothetical protein